MALHQRLPGRRSMLKVDKSKTKSHHGFPRALRQPRMCCLSFGLLLLLCWGQGVGASPSPCPSMCKCYSVDSSSTDCVVDCSNANISSLTEIPPSDLPSSSWRVIHLNISRNSINSIVAKSSVLQDLPYLESLDLSYNDFTTLLSDSFASIVKIKHLNLSHNSITYIGANTFYSMANLISLDLSYNEFTEIDATTFKSTTNLQTLSLAGNLITKFKDKSFEVPLLTTLDLSNNPVTSFERLMFTSSSSITTLYINKMNLTSLPPHLFTNLRLLENLDASSNQIHSLEVETFYGLSSLQYLDISNNKLGFLNASLFRDMHTSLTSLNVAYNNWVCQCSLKPFIEYLVTFNNSAGKTLMNWQNTTCTDPVGQVLLSLNSQFLSCLCKQTPDCLCWGTCNDPSLIEVLVVKRSVSGSATNYFSCYNDAGSGSISTVMYSTVVSSTTASTQQICIEECFKLSGTYASYDFSYCLCGNISSDYNCQCSTNTYADQDSATCTSAGTTETKTYLGNVNAVSAGIILNPIPRLTAGQSYTFRVNVTLDIINLFCFSFGDSSRLISKGVTGKTLVISYTYTVPAQYTLTVSGCYYDNASTACDSASVPVLVDPPDTQVSVTLSASSYEGSINTASVNASFTMGQDLDFYWTRSPDDGITSNSSFTCETSRTFARGRCIQVSSSALDYDTAETSCTNSLLNTIQHSTEVTEFATSILSVSPAVTTVYIEAKKNGSFYLLSDSTYTFFTTDDVTNSTAGECVVIDLNTKALKGADCTATHHYVCQKPPNNACPNGGVYYPTTRNCYLAVTSTHLNWTSASSACQALASGASLATFDSAQLVSHVTSSVLATNTKAWVGLRYQNMDGYLEWVNSESVSAYNPMSSTPTGDCFSLSQTGEWQGYPCSTTLSYICQYSVVKDTVSVEASGVGTMDLDPTSHSYTLTSLATSSTPSTEKGVITIFPGYSIPDESGTVVAWTFKTANLTSSQTAAFQVWRPACAAGETFVTPGCNGNGAKYGSCKSTATTCPTVQTCTEGTKYCFHDDACIPVADLCDCGACTESYVGSSPTYTLIDQTFVVIPANAYQYYTILADNIDVQSNDIIGYQVNTGNNVILCETGGDWAQNAQQSTVNKWLSVSDSFNVTYWKNNTMCYFNAIYSKSVSKAMPSSLGYFTTAGTTEFKLNVVDPVITKTKTITSQEIIGTLTWLSPQLQVGPSTDTIFVESGTSTDLLVVTDFGTNLAATWTIGSATASTTFSDSCPSAVSDSVCTSYKNWPALPFTSTSHTFDISVPVEVHLAVSNEVSSANLTVAVRVFERISGVSIALSTSQSDNYVAYDEQTSFTVTVASGSPSNYHYYVNGTSVYSAFSASFTHKFLNTTVPYHVVTVNVSDDYSHSVAEIGVTVKVRASFQNFQFTNIPSVMEVGTQYEYSASVDATVGAEVSVMWIFGVGPPQLVTMTITSTTQEFKLNFTYTQTGSYTFAIFLQDDSFKSAKYISTPIDIVVPITTVTLSTSATVISEGDSITFTPSLPGPSYYGSTIYYTYNFQDGTTLINQTTTSVSHVFSTLSSPVYSVTLLVMNGISSGNTTVDVTVEQLITSLSLTGTSPILVNTTVSYTAAVGTGSHILYSFQEPTLGLNSNYASASAYDWTIPTVGVYNLTVIAKNTFSTLTQSLEVRAVDVDTLQILKFEHDSFVITASSVVFKLDVLSFNASSLHCAWDFGDGNSVVGIGLTEVSHAFSTANNYTITVTLVHNSTGIQRAQSSLIGVQNTVTNLQVVANGIGNIVSGAAATVVLTASVTTGTDVWYTYTYDGSSFSTMSVTYDLVYGTATDLQVEVVAANQISSVNITLSVTFLESVESLMLNCTDCTVDGGITYCATNATSNYTATVQRGTNVVFTFVVAGQADSGINPLLQKFSTNGDVFVNVTASNKVSSAEYSLPVVVQDTITSLLFNLTSLSTDILVNTQLTMDTIIVGSHAAYKWKMCSTCNIIASSSGSYVNPGYTASGSYTVTVEGYNQISSDSATLALVVHEPVTSVSITSNDLTSGTYVAINTPTIFNATANIHQHVYFDWTIYNSTNTVKTVFSTPTLNYTFTAEGEYSVKVTATNSPSSKETNLTVIVETPIAGAAITNNNTSPIATLTGLRLTATVAEGSTLSYAWYQNNTALNVASENLDIAFGASGTYVMSVEVTNPLGSVTKTITYVVLDVIENATIVIPSNLVYYPFVAVNSAVQFSASVPKGDQVTVTWELKEASTIVNTLSSATFQRTFASVANYTLTMNVTNDVSSMVKTTDIYIQTPLTSLSMTSDTNAASAAETNTLVTFTGVHNIDADHLTYMWTMDSVTTTTTTNTKTHTFTVARTYVASLNVSNQISTYSTSISVEIEDAIQGLSILQCNATVNVTDLAQAFAMITHGTNVTYSWSVAMDTGPIQQTGKTFGHSFQETGIYNLDLNVTNLVGSDASSCWYIIIGPISDVQITMSDDINLFVNYTVDFTVTGTNLVGVIYFWSFSPIDSNTTTETGALSKVFTVKQNYELQLTVSNNINSVTVQKTFYIDELTCIAPVITAAGLTSKTVYKANSVTFEVDINRFTCSSYDLHYRWTAYNLTSCVETLANPVTLTDAVVETPRMTLTNGTLNYGQFCIVLIATYQDTPLTQTVMFNVTVMKSKLVAVIDGGKLVQIPANTVYRLDGSTSYDKDLSSSLQYSWSCTKLSGSAATDACSSVSGSSSSININANDLTAGQSYNVTLTVSATDRTPGYYSQQLIVESTDAPSVKIVCVSCQALYQDVISSAKQLALQGICTNCGSATVTYKWTATYDDSGTNTFSLTTTNTHTGDSKSNLVVRSGQIIDGKPYTFRLTVTKTENSVTTTSYTEIELLANMPPSGTGCTVPTTTITAFDTLTIDCLGFSDPDSFSTELTYKVIAYSTDSASAGQSVIIYSGPQSQVDVYLTSWPGVSRTTVQVKVFIIDSFDGSFEGFDQMITVTRPTLTSGQTMIEYMWEKANTEMLGFIKENSPTLLLQYSIVMIQELNELSRMATDDSEKYMRATLRNILTMTVLGLPFEDNVERQQAATFMEYLTSYADEFQTSFCQDLVLVLTQSLKSTMEKDVRQGVDQSSALTSNLLVAVANVMSGVNMAVYSTDTSLVSGWFNDTIQLYIPSVSSLNPFSSSSSSLDAETHRRSVVTKALSEAEDIIALNLKSTLLGQEPLVYTINSMSVHGQRTTSDALNLDYVAAGSGITVSSNMLQGKMSAGAELFQIYINNDPNPYTWGYTHDFSVNTKTASLSFKDTNGADISIEGLAEEDYVKLALTDEEATVDVSNASVVGNNGYDQTKNLHYTYSTLNSETPKLITLTPSSGVDGAAVYIQVLAKNIDGASVEALAAPSQVSFYLGIDMANPSSSQNTETIVLMASDTLPSDHRNHTFYISNFDTSKTYRISVYVNDTYMLNVSTAMYTVSCMYYDTTELAWSPSGCHPTTESTATAIVCECNHLTAFGGGMLVPIDAISFSDLEFIDLYTNPVVFVTCAIIFVVYIVAAIISRRLDLRDLERISSVPLCGKDGSFKYEITVVTGKQRNAGTSAHVGIKLYGEYGKSNRKHLSKKGAFQRNCQDSFIIAHDTNLGDISKVFIWHDNHGLDPSWYMIQVIVRDLQTDQKYYFFGNIWLTLEKENGFIQKEIYAAGSAEIQKFSRIFGHAWSSSVSDRHLWMSVMDRPANSRFTRVQRATCIVTILYVFMCINVIWYGIIKTSDSNLGTTSFGWQEVVVALATNAVVFPFSILLISIFKKSRSKNNVFEQGIRSGTAETIEMDNNCDQSIYSSFQTNDDLMSYLGERESTEESILATTAPTYLALRRTRTLKTSLKIERMPSSTDSLNSSVSGDKNDRKLERTNNPGTWEQDTFKESWQRRLNPRPSTEESKPGTSASTRQNRAAVKAEAVDAADDIMEYLDIVEADISKKEQANRRNRNPGQSTSSLQRNPSVHRPNASIEESQSSSKDKKGKGGPKKGALKRNDSVHSVGLSAVSSDSYAIPSSSGTQRNFNPREEASLANKKPTSAGSVAKWVSRLKPGGMRSNDMPSVEHTNLSGTNPLRPNSMLARQISQPDIITHGVVGSFTMDRSEIRKKKSGCTLPPWCVYVGYFLCFCLSVLSVIVVMLYGYQLGAEVALQWVLALLFSVTFSFLVFESFKALFMALYIAGIEKKVDPYDENDVIDIEPIVDNAVETVKEMKFKPLAGFSLVKAKEEGQKVQRMRLMLRQFVAYMFYLWLLMVLCYVNFNSSQYYFTYSTENQFIRTTVSNETYSFQNMTSIQDFWVWSQDVLASGLHWEEINNYTEYGTLLGTARLRQVRSLTEKCMAYDSLIVLGSANFLSGKTCVGSGSFDEDQSSYGETWTVNQAQNMSWNYYTSDLTGSKWRQGNVFSYGGGGYVQFLGTNYTETLAILQDLQAKDWINLHTRAVFIEFALYNPATDLTTHVNLLVELPLTGSINTTYEIHSQKLLRYIVDIVDPMMVCEAILFVVVVYLWIHIALLMRDEGCSYFTRLWNIYELLTTLMAMASIGLYVGCVVQATSTFDEFLANSSSFVNFETTVDVHLSMRYVQAWLLFLLMFKIVKQLRFIKILYIYERTLSESVGKLFGVALIFTILFLNHGMVSYLWYGPYVGGFESYWHTLTTLLGAIRGTFDFWLLFEHSRVFSHFFFFSFYIFVYGLTVCLVVAILSDTYKTLRSQMFFKSTLDMQDHEMIDFTMKRFKMWAGITKPKPEFRAVRFPGLPSVSSRCTSSSSTRSFSEASVSSDGLSMLSTGGSANAAARLMSTWQDVLRTMDRVTHLDGVEEDLIKKCQKEIDEWKWQNRISKMEKENDGLLSWTKKKPPPTPNTRTTKIPKRVPTQPRLTAKSEGTAKTPPTKPVVKGKATPRATRPLSDQGGRAAQRPEQPGPSQDRMSIFDFFKSIKPSKPAW